MLKTINFGNTLVRMDVYRFCKIGSGVTVYPDGVRFVHIQRRLREGDLCGDGWWMAHQRADGGNGNDRPSPASP